MQRKCGTTITRLKVSAAHATPARPLLLISAGNAHIRQAWTADGANAEPTLPEEPGDTSWQHTDTRAHDRLAELMEDWHDCHASGIAPPEVWISAMTGPILRDALTAHIARVSNGARVCIAVSEDAATGLRSGYRDPTRLGADRWIDAIGARHLWPDAALLLVTANTATTLDTVTPGGLFAGGLILPGLTLMMHALSRNAAQLPEVNVGYLGTGDVVVSPWTNDTQDAIALGCVVAQADAITQTWQALQRQYLDPVHCVLNDRACVALGPRLCTLLRMHDNLVLLGLQVLVRTCREGAATLV